MKWYEVAHGIKSVPLRYFNAAGADAEGDIGEDHTPETHLIPLVIEAALGMRSHVQVFGTDYPTPDGTAIRDYIHVTDLGDAHVKALEYLLAGGDSVALNLGTGTGYSVKEVISAVESVSGRAVPIQLQRAVPGILQNWWRMQPTPISGWAGARHIRAWKTLPELHGNGIRPGRQSLRRRASRAQLACRLLTHMKASRCLCAISLLQL